MFAAQSLPPGLTPRYTGRKAIRDPDVGAHKLGPGHSLRKFRDDAPPSFRPSGLAPEPPSAWHTPPTSASPWLDHGVHLQP